ncbi:hypothetical protein JQK62_18675, partial [Leptospira santarosai]|nr:hypothetical protein [Leptospira santarosai]
SDIIRLIMHERNSSIIYTRLGLIDGEPKTLQEVGEEFGLSRERIRQIELKFYRRLKYYNNKATNEAHFVINNLKSLLDLWLSPEDSLNPFYVAILLQRLNRLHYLKIIITLIYDPVEVQQKLTEYRSIIREIFYAQRNILKNNDIQKKRFDKLFKDVAWPNTTRNVD